MTFIISVANALSRNIVRHRQSEVTSSDPGFQVASQVKNQISLSPKRLTGDHRWSPVNWRVEKLRLGQRGARLVLQRILGDVHQFTEGRGILGGKVSQHLAVQRDFRGLEPFHEAAVGQTSLADGGIDADLPQITERALLDATIAVSVLPPVVNGIGS